MNLELSTDTAPSQPADSDPRQIVEDFLAACEAEDFEGINRLLDENVTYTNVGLPTIRGRRGAVRFLRALIGGRHSHFGVTVHRIATEGAVVLTERTDISMHGPFHFQFWVCGVFEVHDGRITLWRDYFDVFDITKSVVRALIGAVAPALRPGRR